MGAGLYPPPYITFSPFFTTLQGWFFNSKTTPNGRSIVYGVRPRTHSMVGSMPWALSARGWWQSQLAGRSFTWRFLTICLSSRGSGLLARRRHSQLGWRPLLCLPRCGDERITSRVGCWACRSSGVGQEARPPLSCMVPEVRPEWARIAP